jgi:uncharacterized damage-inducible protein DinB
MITCLESLENALAELHSSFNGEAMWWRGQIKASWELLPSVFRVLPNNEKYIEHALMNQFQMRALAMLRHRPRPLSDTEWLFLAQHYRVPTRLLDWSESLLVALYFAVEDKSKDGDDACLWALSPEQLNVHESNPGNPSQAQNGLIHWNEPVVTAIVSRAFGTKWKDVTKKTGLRSLGIPNVIALASPESDERIVAQSGRFTLHWCGHPLENFERKDKYLRKFLIPKGKAKEIIRQRLELLGIQRWNVFPDLQSLAEGLKQNRGMRAPNGEGLAEPDTSSISLPYIEPWLRGTHADVPAVARAVLHALELALDDLTRCSEGLTDAQLHAQPLGLPSLAFHLRHIAGSVDRILSYAEGKQLTHEQLAALKTEQSGEETLAELMAAVEVSFSDAADRVRVLATANFDIPRAVGRKMLPATIGGALIHVADHTQRHVGQVVTTAKVLKALRV